MTTSPITRPDGDIGRVPAPAGLPAVALAALALALVAALLNAAVGLCLGCEMYLLVRRVGSSAA